MCLGNGLYCKGEVVNLGFERFYKGQLPSVVKREYGCNISTNDKLFFMQISSAAEEHITATLGTNSF